MHLSTRSARLSRFSCALPFSVRIQHSRAAREWVICPEFATGVCVRGVSAVTALGASPALGPIALFTQPVSASVQASNKRTCAEMGRRGFTTADFIQCFDGFGYD